AGGRKFRCLAVGALGLARRPRLRRRRRSCCLGVLRVN
ncbi:hypothetical protein Q9966_007201, partial [Columba livia]